MERIGYGKDQDWHEFKIYIPDGVPEKHLRIGEIVKKKYGLKVLKFKNAKEIMPYARPVFHTLNAAFAPLYGFAQLTEKQIDYYINMYIPMLRYDLVTRWLALASPCPTYREPYKRLVGICYPSGGFIC